MIIFNDTFVILAAGLGSRFKSITSSIPKPLIEFGGRPLIDYVLFNIIDSFPELDRILVVAGYKKNILADYINQLNDSFPCELVCLEAPNYKQGNGHSLLALESSITEPFFLTMCDHLFEDRIYQMLKMGIKKEFDLSLCIDTTPDPTIQVDDATKVLLDQKNRIIQIGKNLLNWTAFDTGLFYVSPLIFQRLNQLSKKYLTLTDGVIEMIRCRDFVEGIDVSGCNWADIDTLTDLQHAEDRLIDYVTPALSDLSLVTVSQISPPTSIAYLGAAKNHQVEDD
ncbi:MAG: NTP transferase domain-containing protein [Promethearchaeota archaeon]